MNSTISFTRTIGKVIDLGPYQKLADVGRLLDETITPQWGMVTLIINGPSVTMFDEPEPVEIQVMSAQEVMDEMEALTAYVPDEDQLEEEDCAPTPSEEVSTSEVKCPVVDITPKRGTNKPLSFISVNGKRGV